MSLFIKKMSQSDAIFHHQLGQFAHRAAGIKLDPFQVQMCRNFVLNGEEEELAFLFKVDVSEIRKAKYGISPYDGIVTSCAPSLGGGSGK